MGGYQRVSEEELGREQGPVGENQGSDPGFLYQIFQVNQIRFGGGSYPQAPKEAQDWRHLFG